jgi:hypothetical protein
MESSQAPDYNVNMQGDFTFNRRNLETNLDLVYGADTNSEVKRIVIKEVANYETDGSTLTLDGTLNAKWQAVVRIF